MGLSLPPNLSPDEIVAHAGKIFSEVKREIAKAIIGQDQLVERLLVALLSDGHVLLEGVPGLAKTKALVTLTKVVHAKMSRVQFTPDLLPSDLLGTEVFRPQSGDFVVRKGPVFTNFLLADEINRAPAKVQSALLQAMQERQVTIGEVTYSLPYPFLVLATQNPIEQEGTYQLPEAQLDRFLMKVKVNYPTLEEELRVLHVADQELSGKVSFNIQTSVEEITAFRPHVTSLHCDERVDRYIVALVRATREPEAHGLKGMIDWGASPRASLALKNCARSLTLVRGRKFITPDEVKEIAPDVLRHRVLPSFEAEARSVTSDDIIRSLLKSVTVP